MTANSRFPSAILRDAQSLLRAQNPVGAIGLLAQTLRTDPDARDGLEPALIAMRARLRASKLLILDHAEVQLQAGGVRLVTQGPHAAKKEAVLPFDDQFAARLFEHVLQAPVDRIVLDRLCLATGLTGLWAQLLWGAEIVLAVAIPECDRNHADGSMDLRPAQALTAQDWTAPSPGLAEMLHSPLKVGHLMSPGLNQIFDALGGWAMAQRATDPDICAHAPAQPESLLADLPEPLHSSTFAQMLALIAPAELPDGLRAALRASEAKLQVAVDRAKALRSPPLVSVIMPTYNRAAVLANALRSVREQSWPHWELLVCDDASTDHSADVIAANPDARIHHLRLPKAGAAGARNAGLAQARGQIITYLDSDNIWHPHFLSAVVAAFAEHPGKSTLYSDFIDFRVEPDGQTSLLSFQRPDFDPESLHLKNYIDLNSFAHRREMSDLFGGFNEDLPRLQDYAVILKYTWLRDPIRLRAVTALYQRNAALGQITLEHQHDMSPLPIIQQDLAQYRSTGLPCDPARLGQRVTILSWDMSRNHFSKAFALAEALAPRYQVKLVSFQFFEDPIFPPLKDAAPSFETAYFPGSDFPEFFATLRMALEQIDGDVIYVVKPRLPSLGLALLAQALRGTPLILEINDLETVIADPRASDTHAEMTFAHALAHPPDLISPYSATWSQVLSPLAQQLPVLVTHNKGLDAHFGNACLYLRNLKDEAVYDPALYDRAAIRQDLGFAESDRVILFGGLLRRHKGIHELVELVDRLGDPAYKLLFVGSRPTPDQQELIERHGARITVLPSQDRTQMARINLAADLVILWLDPGVPASHYQMPYKATDAFAMETAVIANDISDLGDLARQGYLREVAFGDWDAMIATIRQIFETPEHHQHIRAAARRLYLRQFSYAAGRGAFAMAAYRAQTQISGPLAIAQDFAAEFNHFYRSLTGDSADFITLPAPPAQEQGHLMDMADPGDFTLSDPDGVAIILYATTLKRAQSTAERLLKRAGMAAHVVIALDRKGLGFTASLNMAAARLEMRYVVFASDEVYPTQGWLAAAQGHLDATGLGFLAFNGSRDLQGAACGMGRMDWLRGLYGGPILFPGYHGQQAAIELSAIARATGQFIDAPDATLVEGDSPPTTVNSETAEVSLFEKRFRQGFDGLAPRAALRDLAERYSVPWRGMANPAPQPAPRLIRPCAQNVILYRILGNDLSAHHSTGPTLENLRFMLTQDPRIEGCTRKFILNRIIDPDIEARIIALLDRHQLPWLRLPFDPEHYRRISFDVDIFGQPGFLSAPGYADLDPSEQDQAQSAVNRSKTLYAMNTNGARNMALLDGQGQAEWILPWDGNCFVTADSWDAIRADMQAQPGRKVFTVPMAHMRDRAALLQGGPIPEPIEEPQLIFRSGADLWFNEAVADGHGPKVELLRHLGVPGAWDSHEDAPWGPPCRPVAPPEGGVGQAGWAARLCSKPGALETEAAQATRQSGLVRTQAVLRALRQLDKRLAKAGPARLTSVNTDALDRTFAPEALVPGSRIMALRVRLTHMADQALERGPFSVTDKTSLPPSGNWQDYWHPAAYWWPDPHSPDGLPYIRRDGEPVPGTAPFAPGSDAYDRTRLQQLFDDSLILALASHVTGRSAYGAHAVAHLDRFFLDPATQMTAHLTYAQLRIGHNGNHGTPTGLIELKDVYHYLDALRLLHRQGVLCDQRLGQFQDWAGHYLDWLQASDQGRAARATPNHHGTCYDLQVSALAAFLDQTDLLYETLARAMGRIAEQFDADGLQPEELASQTTAHDCCLNVQSWINLAQLARVWGVDLWGYKARSGASLKQGAHWLLSHLHRPWPYPQAHAFDRNRFLPIWFAAQHHIADLPSLPEGIGSAQDAPPVFAPADGIRPFWNGDLT